MLHSLILLLFGTLAVIFGIFISLLMIGVFGMSKTNQYILEC